MQILRYVLLVASIAGAAFPLALLLSSWQRWTPIGIFVLMAYAAGSLLNFIYLLYSERRGT
jgi:hypothetical protein